MLDMSEDKRLKELETKMLAFNNTKEEAIEYFEMILKPFLDDILKGEYNSPSHTALKDFDRVTSGMFSLAKLDSPAYFDLTNFGLHFGFSIPYIKATNAPFEHVYLILTSIIEILRDKSLEAYNLKIIEFINVYRFKIATDIVGSKQKCEDYIKQVNQSVVDSKEENKKSFSSLVEEIKNNS